MGKTLRRIAGNHRSGRHAAALTGVVAGALAWCLGLGASALRAQSIDSIAAASRGLRLDSGRVTVVADRRDTRLAHAMLEEAAGTDTFPGLPHARAHILIAIAPDAAHFREWTGPYAPEWGAAIAFPSEQRIVLQGSFGGSDAGNPVQVLRHELAHLALHEALGDLPPRWFDEGYASMVAGEWTRSAALETSFGMAWRTLPDADALEAGFAGGAVRAEWTYALAHLAVSELQAIDTERGLTNFFAHWKSSGSYDRALREAYGLTTSSFDTYWHQQVRGRYGAFALFADLSLFFGVFGLMLGPLFWARRRRDRRRLDVMRQADAAQEAAARRSALEALLLSDPGVLPDTDTHGSGGSLDTVPGHT
jgi:hypothetical protein